jgi:hypothetical protein
MDDPRVALGFGFAEKYRGQRGRVEDHLGSPRSS